MKYTTLDYVKMIFSMGLVIFSILIVTALMYEQNTKIAQDMNPAMALVIMWSGIIWMSMIEGGKCCMVGLSPVNRDLYKESHPITFDVCSIGHEGDNLDRYLMGRQFMVIVINFIINLCGAPLDGAQALGLPSWIQSIFLGSGLAMILTVVNVGQLPAQVNASHCMLDYINNQFMTFTLYVALIVEKTGVMHCCYLIQYFFYWLAGKPVVTNEPPRTSLQALFFWGRCLWSVGIFAFALAVTIQALFHGQTTMWKGVPNSVAIILFFLLLSVVGMLEGMQIAFLAVSKLPQWERGSNTMTIKTCELLFCDEGRDLPRFMVGRQMFVTLCFFVIARVTTLNVEIGVDENIFGVSNSIQKFFNTGFLGAIVTTILGSISWQLVASAFPLEFLSNPLVYVFLRVSLLLEATGICSSALFLGMIHRKIAGFQNDEVYIGNPEERATVEKADLCVENGDSVTESHLGTDIFILPPDARSNREERHSEHYYYVTSFTERRADILAKIKALRETIDQASNMKERTRIERSLALEAAALKALNEEQQIVETEDMGDLEFGEFRT